MYVQSGIWTPVPGKLLWGCRCDHIWSTMYTTQVVFSEQRLQWSHTVQPWWMWLEIPWLLSDIELIFGCFTVRSFLTICVDFPSPVLRTTLRNWKNRVWNTLTLKSKFWFLQFPVCLVLAELYVFSESHFPYLFHGDDNTPPARRRLCEITVEVPGNKMY